MGVDMPDIRERLLKALHAAIEVEGAPISDDEDFFDGRLELDSIDVLEIVIAIKKEFKIDLKLNANDKESVFRNLRDLQELVNARLTEAAV
jgi:acyl carrier protein